jgi:sulfatase maturation enzyme AslB (radical SAM superfamily)
MYPLKIRAGPDGIHLYNRATGVNLLVDEVTVPAQLWSAAPRQISVALTNACDLHCPFCYAPKHPAKLDRERLIAWLDELDANGCLDVGFGGGEPTLYSDLPSLCRHIARNTGLAVTLTTHALRLDERLAADLKENMHFIRVSMDGIGTTYDLMRGRSFSLLCQRFDTIRKIAPFGVNYLVNACTLPDLDAAVAFAAEIGASAFLLLPEQPSHERKGIDPQTTQALRDWVNSYQGTIPLSVSEAGAAGLPTCEPLVQETGLRAYAHIDATGVLKRSSYDETGVPIGPDGVMQALETLKLTIGGH